MESVKALLESKKIVISLQYYGIQDLGTSWEVKSIVDNQDIFADLYSHFPLTSIDCLDDYYLYLLSLKLIRMREVIPALLQEAHKTFISNLADSAEKAIVAIKPGDLIRYINNNIQEIYDEELSSYDIRFVTLNIIAMYSTGIAKSTFEYLSKDYGYLLIDRFEQFEKTFEQYPDLFEAIYPTGHIEEVTTLRLEKTLDIWSHILRKEKSKLKEIVVYRISILAEDIKQLWKTVTLDNVLQIERTIREFLLFLQRTQSPMAYEFSEYSKAARELSAKSIHEKGQSFKYEIPVEEIVSRWKKTENWELRLLYLTHDLSMNEGVISCVSRLSKEPETKRSLIDMVSSNVPTDDFFTFSHQQMLSILASVGTGTMLGIIRNNDTLIDYLNLVASAVIVISEKICAKGEELQQDVNMLSAMVQSVSNNMEASDNSIHGMCYGASMFTCAISEKLLRLLFLDLVKDEKYVPISKATLGELLVINNNHITGVFGEDHVRNLSFFLQRTPSSNVGNNLRNALAHWANARTIAMRPRLVAHCLWLFTDILNTIFWYCLGEDRERGENDDQL